MILEDLIQVPIKEFSPEILRERLETYKLVMAGRKQKRKTKSNKDKRLLNALEGLTDKQFTKLFKEVQWLRV